MFVVVFLVMHIHCSCHWSQISWRISHMKPHACRKNSCCIKELLLESRGHTTVQVVLSAFQTEPVTIRQQTMAGNYSESVEQHDHRNCALLKKILHWKQKFCSYTRFDLHLEDNTGVIQQYSCESGVVWKAKPTVIPSSDGSSKPHVRLQECCWTKMAYEAIS